MLILVALCHSASSSFSARHLFPLDLMRAVSPSAELLCPAASGMLLIKRLLSFWPVASAAASTSKARSHCKRAEKRANYQLDGVWWWLVVVGSAYTAAQSVTTLKVQNDLS
jgi:hypothetical protein